MKVVNCPKLKESGEISFSKSNFKKAEFSQRKVQNPHWRNFPRFFFFPNKMELEDRNKIEMELKQIIQIESSLIRAKYKKIKQDEESEIYKNGLEKSIKSAYYNIARV